MNDITVLGRNVRRIRGERGLSLGMLAEKAGVAKQTLANLESGSGNPTVDTLLRVAQALGVGTNWLLTEWGSPVKVQHAEAGTWEAADSGRRRLLDRIHGSGQVDTTLMEVTTEPVVLAPLSFGSQHHAYVVSGDVVAGLAEELYTLRGGDFIRFPADMPHVLQAVEGQAVVLVVTTIPRVQHYRSG